MVNDTEKTAAQIAADADAARRQSKPYDPPKPPPLPNLSGSFSVTKIATSSDGATRVTLTHESGGSIPKEQQFAASSSQSSGTIELSVLKDVAPRFQLNQKFSMTLAAQ